jgi:hypothetical protein
MGTNLVTDRTFDIVNDGGKGELGGNGNTDANDIGRVFISFDDADDDVEDDRVRAVVFDEVDDELFVLEVDMVLAVSQSGASSIVDVSASSSLYSGGAPCLA